MTHYFGAHTIDNGGIHMAARRAGAAGMQALQLFTAIPKYYGDKSSIKPERVLRFNGALSEAQIDPKFVMAHAAYVLNTATHEEEKYSRARAGLAKELERSSALGIGSICFHPGAALDDDRELAAERVAQAIVHALDTVPKSATRVLVENTAGAGRTLRRPLRRLERFSDTFRRRFVRVQATDWTPVTSSRLAMICAPQPTRSLACSTNSRKRPASRQAFSISTTARVRSAPTETVTC